MFLSLGGQLAPSFVLLVALNGTGGWVRLGFSRRMIEFADSSVAGCLIRGWLFLPHLRESFRNSNPRHAFKEPTNLLGCDLLCSSSAHLEQQHIRCSCSYCQMPLMSKAASGPIYLPVSFLLPSSFESSGCVVEVNAQFLGQGATTVGKFLLGCWIWIFPLSCDN